MTHAPRIDHERSLRRYVAAVSLGGLAVLVAAALTGADDVVPLTDPGILIFAACIALAECLPVRLSRSGEFTASTSFTFALLWLYGLEAALVVQAFGSVLGDVVHRKSLWRIAFNLGQATLSYAVAGVVLEVVLGHQAGGPGDAGSIASDLPQLLISGLVFFAVNQPLATAAPALAARVRLRDMLVAHLPFEATTTAILIGFAPIVVVVAGFQRELMPLLGLPLIAVHLGGRQSVRNEHQALHDALTGLANRVLFRRDVETALSDGTAAVLVMDLDRFKEVNDTLGHGHGDLLLVAVARRLRPVLSDDATLARLGGDEFAVLLPEADDAVAADMARRLLDAVRAPFDVEGMALEVGTSIGVAAAPTDGDDVETLLKRADIAMYAAKERRSGWLRYAPDMDDRTPERLILVAELRRAIEARELILHYQPKLDLAQRRVTSVEALVRWPHPTRGMVSPGEFIPLAEHTGLIRPLTDWVLSEAVEQAARWDAGGLRLRVAVNISSRSLLEERFAEGVAALLLRHHVEPKLLELEITESVLLADPERAEKVLRELARFGVRLSIDDFGTGYSSLGYLKRLPVHVLKIDRSFVSDMIESASDHAIVASTVALSRNLDLEVVAEGVEDAATMVELSRLGCHMAQGFGISRPVPADDLDAWMRRGPELPKEFTEMPAVRSIASAKGRR